VSRTAHGARLCDGHTVGFSPQQIRKYDPACRTCVELRGHLPEGERDRPAERPAFVFTNRRPPLRRRA
jgi:hypothetical protein